MFTKQSKLRKWHLIVCIAASFSMFSSCKKEKAPEQVPDPNPALLITDQDKLDMLHSLSDLEGDKGRIYEMTYTADYKLDAALNAEIKSTTDLVNFVMANLMDRRYPQSQSLNYSAGCSAFACPDTDSKDYLMGRNFDFNHKDENGQRIMIPVIAVHTAPVGGKKSISFVDGQFINYKSGFYTDGKTDLSMLMALPYIPLDGINEDGFAICVLKLDGNPTRQQEAGKKSIFTTVAMRMLLDRVSTVKQAVEMLREYNMCMDTEQASYHYFMADATGDYAIVEYTFKERQDYPTEMEILEGDDALRYVTNFYVSPSMKDSENGSIQSTHGKDRYNTLKAELETLNYKLNPDQAMDLLHKVAQGPEVEESTGFTQWSEVYNLNKKTVKMSILREYDKTFEFTVK